MSEDDILDKKYKEYIQKKMAGNEKYIYPCEYE
jgi:hypothetical protein